MKNVVNSFAAIAGIVFLLLGPVSPVSGQNSLTLNIDRASATISKEIYGGLLEHWGRDIYTGLYVGRNSPIPNTLGMRNDIIEGMKECGLGIIEYPGGCFSSEYRWRDGIGPVEERWRGDINEREATGDGMGTDEYMELCSILDIEPYICCNTVTGSPEESAEWIRYINDNPDHPEWHVRYWHIGNEPWGCGGGLGCSDYANMYDRFYNALPEIEGKPLIPLVADVRQNCYSSLLPRFAGKITGISAHRYTVISWGSGNQGASFNYPIKQYHQILQEAQAVAGDLDGRIRAVDALDPSKSIGILFNEWGTWYDQITVQGFTFNQSTIRDALVAALHLNLFNNRCERVWLACQAQPVNVIQALFLTDKNDQRRMVKTPTFYTYKLFKPHQQATMIPIELRSNRFSQNVEGTNFNYPVLTASASIDSSKSLYITISNSHPTAEQRLPITLNGNTSYQGVTGEIITAPMQSINDFGKEEKVNIQPFDSTKYTLNENSLTVTLPPLSVVGLRVTEDIITNVTTPARPTEIGFSVGSRRGGKIVFDYSMPKATPIELTLCGLDGRVAGQPFTSTLAAGNHRFVWEPATKNLRSGVYLLRVTMNGTSRIRQVTLTR